MITKLVPSPTWIPWEFSNDFKLEMHRFSYLLFHHLGAENHHLGCRVFHLELSDDGGRVVGHEELLEVIDDHLAN